MYLTRLVLNLRSRDVRRDLENIHNLHQRVLLGFPDTQSSAARNEHGVLFRVEGGDSPTLLVQSTTKPDWVRLPEGYAQSSFEPNPSTRDLGPLLERCKAGAKYRFRLRANATKRLRTGTTVAGKRVEVVGSDNLLAWLLRKTATAGFELARTGLDDLALSDRYRVRATEELKVRGARTGGALTFGSTLFEGELVVTDAAAFRATLTAGIGSAKAYGFGLLSVAPVAV